MKYIKTDLGQRAFKERAPELSARQRAAFILIDGRRSDEDVLQATAGLGITEPDLAQMLAQGFIAPAPASLQAPPAVQVASAAPPKTALAQPSADQGADPATDPGLPSPSALYMAAYPIATQLTAAMGLRGFRLNLAVENASGYEELVALLPRIREAVGPDKSRPLEEALGL